ncbi:ARM repeat-containing protein [Xylaria arbuscula]|nr:ARM repeat-containing protein [Xylaria arbuscula]
MVYDDSSRSSQRTGGVKLNQVYPPPERDTVTDVDVVAIHGLDTDSTTTWTWKHRDPMKPDVNWLKHPDMLPRRLPTARIFTCDWPASLFQNKLTIQMTTTELARSLLLAIQSRPGASPPRPILFIASCLGGIILIQALTISAESGSEYSSLWEATGGVVFLATPFRGTAFQDVASTAIGFLKVHASLTDRVVAALLGSLKESTQFLQDLVGSFTSICVQRRQRGQPWQLASFYETEMSNLLRKFFPPLIADALKSPKPLVDSGSARLDIVPNPIPLPRNHVLMNKFYGPEDPEYGAVSGQVEIIICEIRQARPIDKANAWIRNEQYSLKRLGIERLSGELLPMDRCYINLAIIERPSKEAETSKEHNEMGLFARLRVETFHKKIMLSTIFEPRETRNGQVRPSRILIHGRAGIGKTTLCKKIIYESTHCKLWQDLFDCVFWVPLRNLKLEDRRQNPGYNLKSLFYHEYFTQHPEAEDLADKLWRALTDTKASKMLFVLDGLDEVSDLDGTMLRVLRTLLDQPNVIITSRPNANLPPNLKAIHLELETIGFHPNQVDAYIRNAFTDPQTGNLESAKTEEIQLFLDSHPIIQGLVRIPIQLDALCYSWNDSPDTYSTSNTVPDSMTAIYHRIEESLWRKDVTRLEIWKQNKAQTARPTELTNVIKHELERLGFLAFTGMTNDVITFEAKHRDAISEHCSSIDQKFLLDEMLERVSFVRSSDSPSKRRNQSYHFLHLTFQEYFGARYFAQQWKNRKELKYIVFGNGEGKVTSTDPIEFLGKNKYNARYDIFWRFVAGLLNTGEDTSRFFQVVEEEPRDLLGPGHQRLVMRCLSEVPKKMSLRKPLEGQLSQWLSFECEFSDEPCLPGEAEFPLRVLKYNLEQELPGTLALLESLCDKQGSFGELSHVIAAYLTSEDQDIRQMAIVALRGRALTEQHLQAITACATDDESPEVRDAAILTLYGHRLTKQHLQAIITCLTDEDPQVGRTAIAVLKNQRKLPESLITPLTGLFKHKSTIVKERAVEILRGQPSSETLFQAIAVHLEDKDWAVRTAAIETLKGRVALPDKLLQVITTAEIAECQPAQSVKFRPAIVADLKHGGSYVRETAERGLKDQPTLPEGNIRALVLALTDKDGEVREAAIEALQNQLPLPEDILQAVVILLKDPSLGVKEAASKVLRNQLPPPEGIFQDVELLLEDEDRDVRMKATELLISYRDLSSIPSRHIEIIYESLLWRSFQEYVIWRVEGEASHISIGDKEYSVDWPDRYTSVVQRFQKRLGVPPHLDMRPYLSPRNVTHSLKRKATTERPEAD